MARSTVWSRAAASSSESSSRACIWTSSIRRSRANSDPANAKVTPISFQIAPRVYDQLAELVAQTRSGEVCGVLTGHWRDGHAVVTGLRRARNAAARAGAFAIPDHEMRRLTSTGRRAEVQVVALYHSHPSGQLRLSRADRAALALSPIPWVIVTARDGLAAYAPGSGRKLRVTVR